MELTDAIHKLREVLYGIHDQCDMYEKMLADNRNAADNILDMLDAFVAHGGDGVGDVGQQ